MPRLRSPGYPNISLLAAIDRVRKVHEQEGQNDVSRESFVKLLGYSGLTGPACSLLSSLGKYGLITKTGSGEVKVSNLTRDILFGEQSDKNMALRRAANSPSIFAEINEKWPDQRPTDENLWSFLVRKGFTPKAANQVTSSYRDTMSLVFDGSESYNSERKELPSPEGPKPMHPEPSKDQPAGVPPSVAGSFDIGFLGKTIRMSGTVSTASEAQKVIDALDALKKLLPDGIARGDDQESNNETPDD